MSAVSSLSRTLALFTAANVTFVGASTLYLKSRLDTQDEEFEARMDEIEGTMRGHIGIIEDGLDSLNKSRGKTDKKSQSQDKGDKGKSSK